MVTVYTQGFYQTIHIQNWLYSELRHKPLLNVALLVQSTMSHQLFSRTEGTKQIKKTIHYVQKCWL